MKKLLSLLLAVTFILSAVVIPVSAESAEAFTVSVDTVNATQAQNDIVVPVRLSGNPGISGFSFCVDYDKDNLVLVKSEITIDSGYKVIREISGDGLNLAWTGTDIYTDNGTVANLYFNIVPDATVGKADIRIKYRAGYDSFYKTVDGGEQDIDVVSGNGGVNISNIEAVSELLLNVGNASDTLNETDIVIPISVENNTGISGFSFCVNYDTTRLNLENADIALSNGYKVISKVDGHKTNLAWTSENSFSNNGIIAYLHFSIKENAVSGKGFINVSFRNGYDSFYKVVGGKETDIACTVINGYIAVTEHSYGDWIIVKDASCKETGLKRRICTVPNCGKTDEEIIPKAPHQYIETIVPATCEEQGFTKHICSVCEDVFYDNYTDVLPHKIGDWEQTVAPNCTNSGEEVQKCTVCQAVINRRSIASLGHSYGEWTVFREASFNEDGESRKYCSNCDAYITQRIPKLSETHTHDYSGTEEITMPATCTAAGSKKVYCSEPECGSYICETIPKLAHEYGEWQITTEATFDTDGEKTRQCKYCDAIETERIPNLSEGHVHDFTGREEIVKPATCTEKGEKKVYCLNASCGEYSVVFIDLIDHIKGDWEITEQPTCNKTGISVKKCTVCGKVLETESISMTEHTLIDVVTPPTSTSQGYTTHTCTECGYSYIDSYIDYEEPHVHDFSGSEELIEVATCTKEGSKKVYCTGDDCNEYTVVILSKIAHITGEWEIIEPATCSKCGTKAKKCTVCGKILETADVDMIPHTYVDTVIPPTPTSQGYTIHKCSVCGYQYIDSYTDYVEESPAQIVVESKKVTKGKEFTVTVTIKNNPGFTYLKLTPTYSSELTLVGVENGELISDLTKGKQYIWVADNDVTDDGILMTFTFSTADSIEPGKYEVGFIVRGCVNYDEQNVDISVVNGEIEIVGFIHGDTNGDGVVTLKDVLVARKYVAGVASLTEEEIYRGDLNGDGAVTLKDVLIMRKIVAGVL